MIRIVTFLTRNVMWVEPADTIYDW